MHELLRYSFIERIVIPSTILETRFTPRKTNFELNFSLKVNEIRSRNALNSDSSVCRHHFFFYVIHDDDVDVHRKVKPNDRLTSSSQIVREKLTPKSEPLTSTWNQLEFSTMFSLSRLFPRERPFVECLCVATASYRVIMLLVYHPEIVSRENPTKCRMSTSAESKFRVTVHKVPADSIVAYCKIVIARE